MTDLEAGIPEGVEEAPQGCGRRVGFRACEKQKVYVGMGRQLAPAVAPHGDQREVSGASQLCFPQVEQRAVDVGRALPGYPGPVGESRFPRRPEVCERQTASPPFSPVRMRTT